MKHFFINKTKLSIILASCVMFLFAGCEENDEGDPNDQAVVEKGKSVFVINEGAFQNENSSLGYIDKTTGEIHDDLFFDINDRLLGDVFQSMEITNEEAYLVINNSGVIEVINPETIELLSTISGFDSPRYMLPVDETTAYVSDMLAEKIWIVDLDDHTIESEIEFPGGWSESMIVADGNVFVTAPNANKIYIIDPSSNDIIDNIDVFAQPTSMVTDDNGTLWVISEGLLDWETGEQVEVGGITAINTQTMEATETYSFPEDGMSYSNLAINKTSQKLYYIGGGIWSFDIEGQELPTEPLIQNEGETFYGIDICPQTGDLYATDAIDFNQQGKVIQYTSEGDKVDSFDAGIVPSGFVFY